MGGGGGGKGGRKRKKVRSEMERTEKVVSTKDIIYRISSNSSPAVY